ncbi:hypothetical protein Bbelb_223900 [Branchiostoma belcheri]|nr:hypothetical protein Bbelb_223900 [Branchiostoma belcheri]
MADAADGHAQWLLYLKTFHGVSRYVPLTAGTIITNKVRYGCHGFGTFLCRHRPRNLVSVKLGQQLRGGQTIASAKHGVGPSLLAQEMRKSPHPESPAGQPINHPHVGTLLDEPHAPAIYLTVPVCISQLWDNREVGHPHRPPLDDELGREGPDTFESPRNHRGHSLDTVSRSHVSLCYTSSRPEVNGGGALRGARPPGARLVRLQATSAQFNLT